MQQATFNKLPQKVQDFITATQIPLAHVMTNDFDSVPTPKVYFTKAPFWGSKKHEKTCVRFSLRDAEFVRKWWHN